MRESTDGPRRPAEISADSAAGCGLERAKVAEHPQVGGEAEHRAPCGHGEWVAEAKSAHDGQQPEGGTRSAGVR